VSVETLPNYSLGGTHCAVGKPKSFNQSRDKEKKRTGDYTVESH